MGTDALESSTSDPQRAASGKERRTCSRGSPISTVPTVRLGSQGLIPEGAGSGMPSEMVSVSGGYSLPPHKPHCTPCELSSSHFSALLPQPTSALAPLSAPRKLPAPSGGRNRLPLPSPGSPSSAPGSPGTAPASALLSEAAEQSLGSPSQGLSVDMRLGETLPVSDFLSLGQTSLWSSHPSLPLTPKTHSLRKEAEQELSMAAARGKGALAY